jgi:hypothetical protein
MTRPDGARVCCTYLTPPKVPSTDLFLIFSALVANSNAVST